MVEYTFNSICKEREINVDILGEEEKEKIYQEVFKIWAIPSDNPLTPPPHSTGGAIDLTIMDENKQSIPMGEKLTNYLLYLCLTIILMPETNQKNLSSTSTNTLTNYD